MVKIMDAEFTKRLTSAMSEVDETPGVFFLSLRRPYNCEWIASVAMDDLKHDRIIHGSDPGIFEARDEDAPTAVRLALVAAKKAMGL